MGAAGHPVGVGGADLHRSCANRRILGCNWLPGDADPAGDAGLCRSCALTRTRPDDDDAEGMAGTAKAEAAKRRLVFQLDEIGLPIVSRADDPRRGLAFDLLSSARQKVLIGHHDGVITLDLAESDDAHRARTRLYLGEPYRTLLGHFRHEVGHYYWMVLVDRGGELEGFREVFGDERADYAAAISRHYDEGAPPGWEERWVSEYATMHPWEDWAETFAHNLHIRDTLQTAASFGLLVAGPIDAATGRRDPRLASIPLTDRPDDNSFADVIEDWLPLTYALNAVNRSMGHDDLYPFVLAPEVIDKLSWAHQRIRNATTTNPMAEGPVTQDARG